jgi:uncharacterized membrane protein
MLTNSEKTFIRNWEEQKEGPKWKYYLQFTIAWTIVIFLCLFFGAKVVMTQRDMGGIISFYIIFPVSVISAYIATHLVYTRNEKKLKQLIEKRGEGNGKPE